MRSCQLRLRLSPAELAAITAMARAEGLAAGAWVGQIAVRFARGETEPVPQSWRDLLGELVRFRAEVTGLRPVIDQAVYIDNAHGPGRGSAGNGQTDLLRRVDEVIALALAAGRLTPPSRGASRHGD